MSCKAQQIVHAVLIDFHLSPDEEHKYPGGQLRLGAGERGVLVCA